MKKTLFALFAVLLASFLATCDLLEPPPEKAPPDSTEDGMVRLTVNVAGVSRALTTSNAQAAGAVNYYEVVFKSGTNFYQTEFASGTSGTITIPFGNYPTAADAVMFAGNKVGNDYTLLAVGVITAVTPGPGTAINASTTGVTFTLSALKNNVNYTATSTFQIMGPTNYDTASMGTKQVTDNSVTYPVFPIPQAGFSNADTTFTNTAGNIVAKYSLTIPNNDAVILEASNWTATPTPYTAGGNETGTTVEITEDIITYPINTALPNQCVFTFLVDVGSGSGAVDGLCAVSIDAPVYALSTTAITTWGSPPTLTLVWHIRGGIDDSIPDGIGGNGAPVILGVNY
jgi:hypothetical protein